MPFSPCKVSGFFGFVILRLLHARGHWPDAAFSVHFLGDILFVTKEKLMSEFQKLEQSFLSKVKLLPWAQFVGAWLAVLGLLAAAHAGGGARFVLAHVLAITGVVLGLLAFTVSVAKKPALLSLPHLLCWGGLVVAAAGTVMLGSGPAFWSYAAFLGLGVSQAGQWYGEIYP
jgi:hypothetical protein